MKGRVKRHRGEGRDLNEGLNNGKLEGQRLNYEGQGSLEISCNGYIEGKSDKHFDAGMYHCSMFIYFVCMIYCL